MQAFVVFNELAKFMADNVDGEIFEAMNGHLGEEFRFLDIENDEQSIRMGDRDLVVHEDRRHASMSWQVEGQLRDGDDGLGWDFRGNAPRVRLLVTTVCHEDDGKAEAGLGFAAEDVERRGRWLIYSHYDTLGLHAQAGVRALGRPILHDSDHMSDVGGPATSA